MAFKDEHAPSTLMKASLCAGVLLGTLIPAFETLEGDPGRQALVLLLSLIYLGRLSVCMFVFVQRKIGWFEGGLVSVLFFLMFYLFNTSAGRCQEPLGWIDVAAVGLYGIGSVLNSLADFQRYAWKKKPENTGRLFTQGLYAYAMHINYFGDGLVYIGLAVITREYVCLLVSAGIILNFVLLQIPMQDRHLARKYAGEFEAYAKRTRRFIPFLY